MNNEQTFIFHSSSTFTMRQENVNFLDKISRYIYKAIKQTCGGDISHEEEEEEEYLSTLIRKSISVSTASKKGDAGGQPHDIEVRIALSLYHKWKRRDRIKPSLLTIVSDFGIVRDIHSPKRLAELLCRPLEEAFQEDGIAHDVRVQPSGIICIVTYDRSELLRKAGKLPCPYCCQWCKGTKGLWWHQQQKHVVEYAEATAVAFSSINDLAIVPYNPNYHVTRKAEIMKEKEDSKSTQLGTSRCSDDPIEFVKKGDLIKLKEAVENGFTPSIVIDQRGASPLHWAAGSGHLYLVEHLVEECGCDPNQPQQGKRSFSGRTALHWAARNGHLPVVEYLVCSCSVDIEAATIDGTTAFCWASWQGHLDIMDFLHCNGCNIHTRNKFGCNAALWCAQGKGSIESLKWLSAKKCDLTKINNNGHGVVHKAAQRGWRLGCEWFCTTIMEKSCKNSLLLVGPDTEGYCPSDLAGMEGHEDFGRWLAQIEMKLVETQYSVDKSEMVKWLTDPIGNIGTYSRLSEIEQYTWEKHGGLRRMRSKIGKF